MKFKIFIMIAVAIFIASNTLGAEDQTRSSPSALIAKPIYEFEPVVDGTKVVHDYIIQNKGTETLEIKKVKTG